MTRIRLFEKLTRNNNAGKAAGNTMAHKLMCLFKSKPSLVLCYVKFERGLTFQHQQGKHSSAFFKSTHPCAHKTTHFDDTTVDAFYPDFTQLDQDLLSPLGIPTFKIVDQSLLGSFFVSYDKFESVAFPDFTGKRIRAYDDTKKTLLRMSNTCVMPFQKWPEMEIFFSISVPPRLTPKNYVHFKRL